MRERWDWTEIARFGSKEPVRRELSPSMYREALLSLRQKKEIARTDPLPAGVHMFDFGEGAIVIAVDAEGNYTLGFDGTCPPTSEWAGTPDAEAARDAKPSEKPPPGG